MQCARARPIPDCADPLISDQPSNAKAVFVCLEGVMHNLNRFKTGLAATVSGVAMFAGFTALLSGASPVQAAPAQVQQLATTEVSAALRALDWLTTSQRADGSILFLGGAGTPNSIGDVVDAIFAARAAGVNPARIVTGSGASLLSPLYGPLPAAYASGKIDRMGKLALGLAAANLDPRAFNGLDLVVSMTAFYNAGTGAFGASSWDQSLAVLGWRAMGETLPVTATQFLASRVVTGGGFEFGTGFGVDTNSSGLALQALAAGGLPVTSTAITSTLAWLRSTQLADGGWGYDSFSSGSDVNSTALVIQGLIAVGQDPLSTTWKVSGNSPVAFLLSQQQPDGGLIYLAPPSNSYATAQAIPALVGATAPYESAAVLLRKSLVYLRTQQRADGGFNSIGAGSTVDAINAILSAGGNVSSFVSSGGNTPLQYLTTLALSVPASGAASAGKLATGVAAAGGNPRNFGGANLVLSITQHYSTATGRYGSSVWDQSWALLGLASSLVAIPPTQTQQLIDIAAADGGYGFFADDAFSDCDSTGLALMALRAAGVPANAPAVLGALNYLKATQLPDGGFSSFGGTNANSTGLALQGLAAYNEPGRSLAYGQVITDGTSSRLVVRTAIDALAALALPDGSFTSTFSIPAATYAAVPGIAFKTLPLQVYATNRNLLPVIWR